jgi:hypothetical protein
MLLKIFDRLKIDEVQDKFNECFPYLKLEFYSRPHKWQEASHNDYLIQPGTFIEDIRKTHDSGLINIKSWDQTGKVEQDFHRVYGLNVQIFRRDRNKWIQTSDSDGLTLREQSELSRKSLEKRAPTAMGQEI